jgi:putative FmdB family regulatory protein
MAMYDYRCFECGNEQEEKHGMNETPEIECRECGKKGINKMIPKILNFVLKGDNWSGKNAKEKSYRMGRRKEMGKKMAESHNIPSIYPNYKGEVCSNWDEAKKLAKDDGVDSLMYEKQVQGITTQQKKLDEKKKKLLRGDG